jgi:hypothetical protein
MELIAIMGVLAVCFIDNDDVIVVCLSVAELDAVLTSWLCPDASNEADEKSDAVSAELRPRQSPDKVGLFPFHSPGVSSCK